MKTFCIATVLIKQRDGQADIQVRHELKLAESESSAKGWSFTDAKKAMPDYCVLCMDVIEIKKEHIQ